MAAKTTIPVELSVAATVAGEDIACGDYVAVLSELIELPSYLWERCGNLRSSEDIVRIKVLPRDAGEPLKVIGVCLPFTYVKCSQGTMRTIDMRRIQLVRLDTTCAKAVWKQLRSSGSKEDFS